MLVDGDNVYVRVGDSTSVTGYSEQFFNIIQEGGINSQSAGLAGGGSLEVGENSVFSLYHNPSYVVFAPMES